MPIRSPLLFPISSSLSFTAAGGREPLLVFVRVCVCPCICIVCVCEHVSLFWPPTTYGAVHYRVPLATGLMRSLGRGWRASAGSVRDCGPRRGPRAGLETVMDGDVSQGPAKAKKANPRLCKVTWTHTNTREITRYRIHTTSYGNTHNVHIHEDDAHTPKSTQMS